MNRTYFDIIKDLDANIPRDVISLRDAPGGRQLSYLEGHYVIDRLNKVLGIGQWAYSSDVTKVYEGTLKDKYGKEKFYTSYISKVKLVVQIGDEKVQTEFTDVGYGDGQDPTNPGKAHELAVKEAVTDGIKRCAKNLGMSLGLALYNKTQENVDDGSSREELPTAARGTEAEAKKIPSPSNGGSNPDAARGSGATAKSSGYETKETESRDDILRKISAVSQAKVKLKRATIQSLTELLKSYGVETKENLTEVQAKTLLNQLEAL